MDYQAYRSDSLLSCNQDLLYQTYHSKTIDHDFNEIDESDGDFDEVDGPASPNKDFDEADGLTPIDSSGTINIIILYCLTTFTMPFYG